MALKWEVRVEVDYMVLKWKGRVYTGAYSKL